MTHKGWECPKCGQVYAPTVTKCETCVAAVEAIGKPLPITIKPLTPIPQNGTAMCGGGRVSFVRDVLDAARNIKGIGRASTA